MTVLLFAVFSGLRAQSATVSAASTDYAIGDRAEIKLKLELPKGYTFKWPVLKPDSGLELSDTLSTDSSITKDSKTYTRHIFVTAFDSGVFMFPALQIEFRKDGDTAALFRKTEPVALNYHRITVDTAKEIIAIKEPVQVPPDIRAVILYAALALLALGIIFLVWYFWRKKKLSPATKALARIESKNIPPWQKASEKLDELEKMQLWEQGQLKQHYVLLSLILRQYIQDTYRIEALEYTTSQIMENGTRIFPAEASRLLGNLLETADLVKFAKHTPDAAEIKDSIRQARDFVRSSHAGN
jgi:hypothetical protein